MKKIIYIFLIFFLQSNTNLVLAQKQTEKEALEEEEFTNYFYESLTQKGIENYDKAIVLLEKCLELQPNNAVVYHEIGKNYFFLKDYSNATQFFQKATQLETENKWLWIDLYETYYTTKDYNQAIAIAQKIIPLDNNYKNDLLSLYMQIKEYDKALVLINQLNETEGNSTIRENYKSEILAQKYPKSIEKNELEIAIKNNPLIEENYLLLIELYSKNNQEEKSKQWTLELEKNIPNSPWAQVFLFKRHLSNSDGNSAEKSMEIALNSEKINNAVKFKMLNEFLIFASNNPSFENSVPKFISYFEKNNQFDIYQEVGVFYYKKKKWDLAIINLEKATNLELSGNIFLLSAYENLQNFTKLLTKATSLLEEFPNQPEYYLFAGKAAKQLNDNAKAIILLETGLDYTVANKDLEIAFLNQLIEVSKLMGNLTMNNKYLEKIKNLK